MLPHAALPARRLRTERDGLRASEHRRDPQPLFFAQSPESVTRWPRQRARLAAPIIRDGQSVMGSVASWAPIRLTPEHFASLAADGQVRFVLLGGDFPRRAGGESPQRLITDWIKANGAVVDPALWRSTPASPGRTGRNTPPALYDLRPAAGLVPSRTG
jgi:hypothetical protein